MDGHSPVPQDFRLSLVVADFVVDLGDASLAWSDNIRWGLHQLSILASLFILAYAWLTVPLKTKRQLTSWVFCSGALAMAGVLVWGLGELWIRPGWQVVTGPVDIAFGCPCSLRWAWFGDDQPRPWRLAYLRLWIVFTAVTGSFTSALLLLLALMWSLWNTTSERAIDF